MKLARVFCSLIILGSSAIAAYAQTPIDPFAGDAHVILNDPSCTQVFCIELTSAGPANGFFFSSIPASGLPNPDSFTCASDVFIFCTADTGDEKFFGYTFFDGTVTEGEKLTLSSNAPILLMLPAGLTCDPPSLCPSGQISLSPEPGTALLYMTGLGFLVGFARKRFGANFLT